MRFASYACFDLTWGKGCVPTTTSSLGCAGPTYLGHARPPKLGDCFFSTQLRPKDWLRYRTVDLAKIRGITFFYHFTSLVGIHVHDSSHSCASATFNRLLNWRPKVTVWVYLPIARRDRVVAVGVRGAYDTIQVSQSAVYPGFSPYSK